MGGGGTSYSYGRPTIGLLGGKVTHNGSQTRVVMRRDLISVGCSDVTPAALRFLLAEYDKRFATEEVVLQP